MARAPQIHKALNNW